MHRKVPFYIQKNKIHTAKWKKTRMNLGIIDEER